MEEIVKHINDTNASYRTVQAGNAKNTDLFLDNEHYELFKDAGEQITVRFNKENLQKAILFIASILPRKYDNAVTHKIIGFSSDFVFDQLAFLDAFFTNDGVNVETRTQIWNSRKDVPKKNGEIDKRFYFNGLLEDVSYKNHKGETKTDKFTIRNYVAGGYSDLHIKKASDGIFDIWVTNTQTPYNDGKDKDNVSKDDLLQPLQQIFYGAPGTGKSFKIDEMTQKYPTIRTTFHPDSDYSTFVGAYKPIMEDIDVKVTPVVVENGISLQPSGTYKERRIAYKFVKQAFLKAYLGAWKKYVDHTSPTGSSNSTYVQITYKGKNFEDVFTLDLVTDNHVEYTKATIQSIDIFKTSVEKCWNKVFDSENINNMMYEAAACYWYNDNNPENPSFDNCWMAIMNELNQEKTIESSPGGSQTYLISKNEENIIIKTTAKASKIKIEERFNTQKNNSRSIQKLIADKLKEYNVDFGEAWKMLKKDVENSHQSNSNTNGSDGIPPQFLIIEEINRGNCAQIFGDIFQLLDRSDNRFSTYPIEADTDLQQEVSRAFKEDKEYKLLSNIEIEGKVKNYTSNYGANLSEDVQEGRVLLFPPNLYIWATMNTSDQSLFPIDSAFKRRWDWKYIPIKDHEEKDFKIDINGTIYSWWGFLEKINNVIGKVTSSEDKKLGYFFVKANGKDIDATKFVGKVLFYLWNDVFKNYGFDNTIFSRAENKKFEFSDFFDKNGEPETTVVNEFLKKLDETIDKDNSFIIKKSNDTVSSEEESSDEDNEQQEG